MPLNVDDPQSDASLAVDQRIAESANQRLRTSSIGALRSLKCECQTGQLRVRGQVPTYYARQIAFETLRKMKGVTRVLDEIEVVGDSR